MSIFNGLRSALTAARLAAVVLLLGITAACSADNVGVLHTAKGDYTFKIELATTEVEREKGLMFRTELAPDAGMLFVYPDEEQVSFWMQNTLIPLDMLFIAADGTVKTIHVNARPLDTTPIPSDVPVQYVLEIAGGRADEIGLKPGDKFESGALGKSK